MSDDDYMRRCIQLAENGLGAVAPNPMVGAVIVHEGRIIGEGYHRRFGEAHAEVNAIARVARPELLQQSTLYVNLEPCSHYGHTPPCSKLIISKHIPRVVIANVDPNPKVAGRGIRMMREAGIEVITGVLEKEGEWLNRRFFTFQRLHRPYIQLKWAQSADGFLDRLREENNAIPPVQISSELTKLLVQTPPLKTIRNLQCAVGPDKTRYAWWLIGCCAFRHTTTCLINLFLLLYIPNKKKVL